ncbi:integrase arm-type DNA-binding domain-containing protein [Roseomonas hellenica]|uniref:Integrase arm-type DNA-binding domain-containing protein n=1 Tax=Plastoroseomonas hellenica TaxID=2687306 RepID=A0ABS5EUK2_9PROT|nr:integrase arm-type DNA-binding domain-containing protein [Plastoroseomonas hellenica]MBR0663972.1 integrase arm-type DNA-binding domain-containing protein [Plastoroseomonas hellenica]
MLTDAEVRAAKPRGAPYKLSDGAGLHLYVTPAGSRIWRYRYEIAGREKLLTIGPYPEVTLAQAREERTKARAHLRASVDPAVERKKARLAATDKRLVFEAVARDWHARRSPGWTRRHSDDVLNSLERDVFPAFGSLQLRDITPAMVLGLLRPIEARPAIETARRVRQRISAVFVFAVASGIGENDPAAMVKGALAPLVKGRQPAVLDLDGAREMLQSVEGIPAHPVTKLAHRFLALTVVRPGEIRGAKWSEFEDLSGAAPIWRIPAQRMKMRREHLVPLSPAAVEVLDCVRRFAARSELVFPSVRQLHRPMSENAIGYLLNRAGYHGRHVPHGWRATFSTIMNERFRMDRGILDLMLAHSSDDEVESAYNRALYLDRRKELAEIWAGLLLEKSSSAINMIDVARKS